MNPFGNCGQILIRHSESRLYPLDLQAPNILVCQVDRATSKLIDSVGTSLGTCIIMHRPHADHVNRGDRPNR